MNSKCELISMICLNCVIITHKSYCVELMDEPTFYSLLLHVVFVYNFVVVLSCYSCSGMTHTYALYSSERCGLHYTIGNHLCKRLLRVHILGHENNHVWSAKLIRNVVIHTCVVWHVIQFVGQ